MSQSTFEVDKKGMSQVFGDRSLDRAVLELLSNAHDEQVTRIDVVIEPAGPGLYRIRVEDDSPEGFRKLSDAYTLFAPSYKKPDATKRGRFNFGEKWVVAACVEASIVTTTGGVRFDADGRHSVRQKRESGTLFVGTMRSNREMCDEAIARLKRIIPDNGVTVTVNGEAIPNRIPVVSFEESLPTVVSDDEGVLKTVIRKTTVNVYDVQDGETASIHEMGVPVVETDDQYHYDVRQRVPLSLDRDNVPPSYLKKVRTAVLNHTASLLSGEAASEDWVNEALEKAHPEAVVTVMDSRFGEKRATADPSDREAENRLKGQDYTIVPSGAFSREAWDNIRASKASLPAGRISPTPKPFSSDPNVPPFKHYEPITAGMRRVKAYSTLVASKCLHIEGNLEVVFADEPRAGWLAAYGKPEDERRLILNVGRLGLKWFDDPPAATWEIEQLLIHELGHERGTHLEADYDDALCEIGAKLSCLKATNPELFSEYVKQEAI